MMSKTISERLETLPTRSTCQFRALILMAFLLLLSACNQQDDSGRVSVNGPQTDMSFTPPIQLLSARSIVRANLILDITIDGRTSRVEPNTNGVYELKTQRPANSSTSVTLVWSELIDGEPLPLARATKILSVGSVSSPAELRFSSADYDKTSDDKDGDGYSNYIERRDGDDDAFNDPNNPDSPPVIVTVDVRLSLPVGMRNATAARRAEVTARAFVNTEEILLTRVGDVWSGSTTVTESSEPLVTATFYATSDRRITIASLARNQDIGGGGQVIFNEDDYDVDSFNDDGDDFTNIRETAIGSNPRDSNDPRAPVANAGRDISIASGATATLDGSGSSSDPDGAIATYRWTEGTQLLATGVSPVISGLTAGSHVIDLLVTDNLGLTDTDSVTVTVEAAAVDNQLPVANAGNNQTIASGASVTLNGGGSSDPDGTIEAYRWTEGSRFLGSGVSLLVTDLTDGPHTITLLVTDDAGATDTDTVLITVTAAPPAPNQAPVADAGVDRTINSGDPVTLDGSGSSDADGTIDAYQWSEGPQLLGSGESLTIPDLSDGEHVITLLVTDDDGATGTATVTVTVTVTAAPAPNQPPEADAGEDQTVNSGDSVMLDGSGSSDPDGPIAAYSWSEGALLLGTGESLIVTDLSDGEHEITLLVTDEDEATGTDMVLVIVTAAPAPNQPPMADAGADQTISSGDAVTLNASDSVDGDSEIFSYEWFEDTELLDTGITVVITELTDGLHVIDLVVTDVEGATGTDSVAVTVTAAGEPVDGETADGGSDRAVDGAKTSATGAFVVPIRTLA